MIEKECVQYLEREKERERKSVRKGQDKLVFEVKTGKYFSLKLAI